MRLYHQPGSRSTRVLWALEEIGAPYELTLLTHEDKDSPEHHARHPLGRVPVVELDDGTFVFESGAICLHLADLHPEAGLLPAVGTPERGLAYQWSFFAMAEIERTVFGWMRAKRAGRTDLEELAQAYEPVADALEGALSDGPWLLGDTFTVADILCSGPLGTAYRRGLTDRAGVLRDYLARTNERPANVRAEAVR